MNSSIFVNAFILLAFLTKFFLEFLVLILSYPMQVKIFILFWSLEIFSSPSWELIESILCSQCSKVSWWWTLLWVHFHLLWKIFSGSLPYSVLETYIFKFCKAAFISSIISFCLFSLYCFLELLLFIHCPHGLLLKFSYILTIFFKWFAIYSLKDFLSLIASEFFFISAIIFLIFKNTCLPCL